MEVCGGMPVGGIVTAADVAALQADAQVQPHAAFAQAVLAAVDAFGQLEHGDRVQVGAVGHVSLSVGRGIVMAGRGSQMWNVVPLSPVSNVTEPPWRSTTIRRTVSR